VAGRGRVRQRGLLLVSADEASDRAATIRTTFRGFPLTQSEAPDIERLLWRYIRGEVDIDGLRAEAARASQDPPDDAAKNDTAETVAGSASSTADHAKREKEAP
jgi:hypothetical protein